MANASNCNIDCPDGIQAGKMALFIAKWIKYCHEDIAQFKKKTAFKKVEMPL